MWSPHVASEANVIPKCVWVFSWAIMLLLNSMSWLIIFVRFLVNKIDFVLFGFSMTHQFWDHGAIWYKSSFSILTEVSSSITVKRDVSSANSLILLFILSTISLIYNKNKYGPRTEPWGTPAEVLVQVEWKPSWMTLCFLSERQLENQLRREPQIPYFLSLNKRPLCHTLSSALLTSQI